MEYNRYLEIGTMAIKHISATEKGIDILNVINTAPIYNIVLSKSDRALLMDTALIVDLVAEMSGCGQLHRMVNIVIQSEAPVQLLNKTEEIQLTEKYLLDYRSVVDRLLRLIKLVQFNNTIKIK